jgi:hypothetical protein
MEAQLATSHATDAIITEKDKAAWQETTIVVLNGISSLFADYLTVLTNDKSFTASWATLLQHFTTLLAFDVLDINTAIFKAFQHVLSQGNTSQEKTHFSKSSIDLAWQLWAKDIPITRASDSPSGFNNHDCLLAYVSSSQEIYRLIADDLSAERIKRMLELLRDTVQYASAATYSADIEYLTPLQSQVLEAVKMIRTDVDRIPEIIVLRVAELAAFAFRQPEQKDGTPRRPTYVALSKSAMTLLESLVITHASNTGIYTSGALTSALMALASPIVLKYAFPISTKSQAPWRQATTSALAIISATLHMITSSEFPEEKLHSIWSAIITVANGIVAADCSFARDTTSIIADQDFDINSFVTLRELITPACGASNVTDKTRQAYTASLFHISLIHAPEPQDLPKPSQDLLACLDALRKGRTIDPAPSLREKMAYICLHELISLVSVSDSSTSRVRLAQAAAPYLILRIGLTLKAYIADQPLRGRMPQPLSQRKELLYILRALVGLRCEPAAIPELEGVRAEGKSHLHRLYPLLARAVRAAARDQEVLEWLVKALDEVGKEFGA